MMLAIKSVLTKASFVPTLIFDEIDAGVGGRTANVIGRKLSSLAESAQVICVTHLARIASQPAQAHFYIEKAEVADNTIVSIRNLDVEARVGEIARMLGGSTDQDAVMLHARELLSNA